MGQQIRFCTAPDGARLAYAVHGSGPPIVRVATWLTHLEFDWESPVWRHWLEGLGTGHSVVRYDERGCGLSDREVGELSVDAWVGDLEAIVGAAGLDRFALLGVSQGAAIALAYAARHPERVTRLVLYGGYARGRKVRRPDERAQDEALISAIRAGWDHPNPTFRHVFSMLFLPHGTPEQMAWYDDLLRRSASAETAARLYDARGDVDVVEIAPKVSVETLVVHARDDRVVPVEEGRLLAALIPDAELVLLESANHILLADEPAWPAFMSQLHAFLGTRSAPVEPPLAELSPRELEVLTQINAIGRFLRACTSQPLDEDDWRTALSWNMVVPAEVRGALISREIDADDVLASLSVPVLVTHGSADAIVLPSMAEHVLEVCRTAEPSWYEGIGHMPFWESFERFNSELGQFVSRVNERDPRRSKDGRLAPDAPDVA